MEATFKIDGMSCEHCQARVRAALLEQAGRKRGERIPCKRYGNRAVRRAGHEPLCAFAGDRRRGL